MKTGGTAKKTKATSARVADTKPEVPFALANFPSMPNEAHVDIDVVAALFSCGKSTVWAWTKTLRLPAPRKFGRSTRWNVGDIRAVLAGSDQ